MPHSGLEARAIMTAGSVWGTAVQGTGSTGMLVRSFAGIGRSTNFVRDVGLGEEWARKGFDGLRTVEGSPPLSLRYEGCELSVLAYGMGSESDWAQLGGTAAYGNTVSMEPSIADLFFTFAFKDGVAVREFASCKVGNWGITGEQGDSLILTPQLICWDEQRGAALTNTVASINSATLRETGKLIEVADSVFKINDESAGALGGGDALAYVRFALSFPRGFKRVHAQSPASTSGNAREYEPATSGEIVPTMEVEFPYFESNDLWDDFDAATAKKWEMLFEGTEIESPYDETFRMRSPSALIIAPEEPVEDSSAIDQKIMMELYKAASAPTGMAGTDPLEVYLISTEQTSLLAI